MELTALTAILFLELAHADPYRYLISLKNPGSALVGGEDAGPRSFKDMVLAQAWSTVVSQACSPKAETRIDTSGVQNDQ